MNSSTIGSKSANSNRVIHQSLVRDLHSIAKESRSKVVSKTYATQVLRINTPSWLFHVSKILFFYYYFLFLVCYMSKELSLLLRCFHLCPTTFPILSFFSKSCVVEWDRAKSSCLSVFEHDETYFLLLSLYPFFLFWCQSASSGAPSSSRTSGLSTSPEAHPPSSLLSGIWALQPVRSHLPYSRAERFSRDAPNFFTVDASFSTNSSTPHKEKDRMLPFPREHVSGHKRNIASLSAEINKINIKNFSNILM